jgi:osmotically-inducible protein OsmY
LSGGRLRREFDDSSFTRGRNYAQRDAERRESSRYDQNRDLSYGRDTSYDRDTSFGQSSPGWPRRYDEEELFGRDYTGRQQHRRIPITGEDEDRGWWERTSDAVASWFGDEEAERRRRMDKMEGGYRGRGPKGYRRSDERIREDINDRLSDNDYLDAYDIEVVVSNGEVVLSGVVRDRYSKRIAEDVTEQVSGVTNVENRLRLKQDQMTITGEGGESREGTTSSATAAKIGK